MNLDVQIEAVLFYKTEPIAKKDIAALLETTVEDIDRALINLRERLCYGAMRIVEEGDTIWLTSAPEVAHIIEKIRKDELVKEIGKAGAETLAIVLYRGPISRSEIDSIRGVNSTFILRNLQIRGLVERIDNPKDSRSFQYKATPSLFAHLGITRREDLPEYVKIMNELDAFEREAKGGNEKEDAPVATE